MTWRTTINNNFTTTSVERTFFIDLLVYIIDNCRGFVESSVYNFSLLGFFSPIAIQPLLDYVAYLGSSTKCRAFEMQMNMYPIFSLNDSYIAIILH